MVVIFALPKAERLGFPEFKKAELLLKLKLPDVVKNCPCIVPFTLILLP